MEQQKMRRADAAWLIAWLVTAMIGLVWLCWPDGDGPDDPALPPCVTDEADQADCHWDARTQGNGLGRSFSIIDGVVTYDVASN